MRHTSLRSWVDVRPCTAPFGAARRTALLLWLIGLGAAGCGGGDKGPKGDTGATGARGPAGPAYQGLPSIVHVSPARTFAARPVTLTVSGAYTHFGPKTTLTLNDAAITPGALIIGGTNFLEAPLLLGASAAIGPHDLKVTTPNALPSGDEVLTAKGSFAIAPSLSANATGNSLITRPGGPLQYALTNLDTANPFTGPVQLGGARQLSGSFTQTGAAGVALADALTPAGPLPITLTQGPVRAPLVYAADPADPNLPAVTALTPVELQQNVSVGLQGLVGTWPSNLYHLTTAANDQVALLVLFNASGGLASTGLYGATAPATGSFSAGQFVASSVSGRYVSVLLYLPSAGSQYVTLFPRSFTGDLSQSYSITATLGGGRGFSAREPAIADGPSRPLAQVVLDKPAFATDGAFDTASDQDFIVVQTPKAGHLYAYATTPGLGSDAVAFNAPPPLINLLDSTCTTPQVTAQAVQQEIPVTAGTSYCVRVEPRSALGAASVPTSYLLVLSQEL